MEQLRTAFIEGTNEQYSIREDGVVIQHYLKKGCGYRQTPYIDFKNVELSYRPHPTRNVEYLPIKSNGRVFNLFKNSLLAKYFNFIICPKCGTKIETSKHLRVCKSCIKDSMNTLHQEWRDNNRVLYRLSINKSYRKNRDSILITAKNKGFSSRKTITKNYAASKLGVPIKDLTDDLYELYKAQLQVKRVISQKTNIPTNLISINNVKNQKLLHSNRPDASSI